MWDQWNDVFRDVLGPAERSLVSELRGIRNQWAHNEQFISNDAIRALDSTERLLNAVSAAEAATEVGQMRMDLMRVVFDEQRRSEMRKKSFQPTEGKPQGGLKPWREVVTPHPDVASGRYQQAEFAADLWQVYQGEGSDEYKHPTEFFRRTFLTEGLRRLLTQAVSRLSGQGGDPVVELQTNFGGGKTHSELALYHLFSGTPASELPGVEELVKELGIPIPKNVKRAVFVGTQISPGKPHKKPDGTVVRTLWGEIAWQLGGKEGYKLVKEDDEHATNPGNSLKELFNKYGPCLILIDEWVAYARQLHTTADLPAGTFETHFTFAQALSEAAKAAKNTLLVVSIPASESPHQKAERGVTDIEVGGERGREALARLKNAIGRVEASWRPASPDEGFEIVRRRLFQPLSGDQFVARDAVARAFVELYGSQQQEFPSECREADYERRIKMAYPIHPELFDRLYNDWSTLDKFQRTRGVLRLMAAVIHSLWERQDSNVLIMPGNVPVDDQLVQFELTRYLEDQWVPVIEKDVDGANSLPLTPGPGEPEPWALLRLPPCFAHDLHGLGPDPSGVASRHRRPAGEARLRAARRGRRHLRRCPPPAHRQRDLPLRGRQALLVLDPADRDPPGRRPRRPADRRPGRRTRSSSGCGSRPARGPTSPRSMPAFQAATFPTNGRPGWSSSGRISRTPTAMTKARPAGKRRRSSIRAEARPATSRTRWSSSPATPTGCESWSKRSGSTSPGHRFGTTG